MTRSRALVLGGTGHVGAAVAQAQAPEPPVLVAGRRTVTACQGPKKEVVAPGRGLRQFGVQGVEHSRPASRRPQIGARPAALQQPLQ